MIVEKMKANERKTKKSKAVGYGTFGRSVRASSPRNVIVRTVVIPKETLSAVASRFSQKDTHDNTTSRKQGPVD
jgi:hypothetical protein